MLKKKYVKPAVYSEDIKMTLMTGKLHCSATQPNEPYTVGGFTGGDPDGEEDPVDKVLFLDEAMGCVDIITLNNAATELGDNYYWCYQNPSDATRVFVS